MATLKANGGVFNYLVHAHTGNRVAVCMNGKLLIRRQGRDTGWKQLHVKSLADVRSPAELTSILEARGGYRRDASALAETLTARSIADAHAHEQAKRIRRLIR